MSLTVKALSALLDEADPDALVVIARFDGDEVHTDTHIDDKGQVVIREQGREFALERLAAQAAAAIVDDPAVPVVAAEGTSGSDAQRAARDRIHAVIAGGVEPVKPIMETRVGEFADDE